MNKPTMPKAAGSRKKKPHEIEPWYKRYPLDIYEDTRDLKPDERGLYNDCLDLIYMAAGPIADDDRRLAHKMHVDIKVWRRIRRTLLATGKLYITCGKLMNKRCKEVLDERKLQLALMGRQVEPNSEVAPDLFGNANEINGDMASRSTDSDSERERESTSLRVIIGGRGRHISSEALQEAADLFTQAGLKIDKYELQSEFWAWPKSATAVHLDQAFLGFAGRRLTNAIKKKSQQ